MGNKTDVAPEKRHTVVQCEKFFKINAIFLNSEALKKAEISKMGPD